MKNLLLRKSIHKEDGVAMILAVIIILIIGAILTNVVMLNVKSSQKSVANREWIVNGQGIESAIQNSLALANGSSSCTDIKDQTNESCIGYYTLFDNSNPDVYHWSKGSEGDVSWKWRAKEITVDGKTTYDIYAIAHNKNSDIRTDSRAAVVRLTHDYATGYKVDDEGDIQYTQPSESLFGWSALANDTLTVGPGVTFPATNPKTTRKLGTSQNIKFTSDAKVSEIDQIDLLNSSKNKSTERCEVGGKTDTGICADPNIVMEQDLAYPLTSVNDKVERACGTEESSEWKASEADKVGTKAILEAGCYSSITVDADTVVTDEDGKLAGKSPAEVYINNPTGTYTQALGTSITAGDRTGKTSDDASKFALYTVGASNIPATAPDDYRHTGENRKQAVIFENEKEGESDPGITNAITFKGMIGASAGSCSTSDGRKFVNDKTSTIKTTPGLFSMTGSMACKSVYLGQSTNIKWEPRIMDIEQDLTQAKMIWTNSRYSNSTAKEVLGSTF